MFARVCTANVAKLEVPLTFKFVPKIDEPLRVVTLIAKRFAAPSTFADPDRNRFPVLSAFDAKILPIT